MKKILTIAVITAFAFSVASVGTAFEPIPDAWKIQGEHSIVFTCGGGEYNHTLTDGFPGSGTYDANNAYTWDMTGSIIGDVLNFTMVYTGVNAGYTLNGVGTISPDGSINGTTDGNCQTFLMEAGTATKVTPEDIMAIADGYIHGGGHMLEETEGKRKDWLDVGFGGWVADLGADGYVGEWQVNLHNVNDGLDKSKFHGTEVTVINFYNGNSPTCNDAVNFTVKGTLDGEDGYRMIFRAGDNGSPNNIDTVRVELYDGGSKIYDTHAGEEFTDESSCVGGARTGLDTGNITIYNP
ncbi:hypothetical protein ACFL1Y_01045 [Patescibacteria group bacterium]